MTQMKLSPYLFFNGNCKEAMEFYHQCLGGKLDQMKLSDSPIADQYPAEAQSQIMHSYLESGDLILMASDNMGQPYNPGDNVNVCLHGVALTEVEALFNKLSEGGKITMPLKEEFFGMFGSFVDKFGINWMIQSDPKPAE